MDRKKSVRLKNKGYFKTQLLACEQNSEQDGVVTRVTFMLGVARSNQFRIGVLLRCVLLITCFVSVSPGFAQTARIDSLQSVLKTLPEDTNRVNTLIDLCRAQSLLSTEKMEQTARTALKLAHQINFQAGEANANIYLALYYKKTGSAPQAIEFLLKALDHYEKTANIRGVALCNNNIGVIYLDQKDLKEALNYFNKAYAAWSQLKFKSGIVRSLNNIASVYEEEKRDSLALGYYTRALKLCEEIHDKAFTGLILNSMGMIYLRQKEYATSMALQERALRLGLEANDVTIQAQSYGAMSEIYAAQDMPEKALVTAKKGLENALKITSRSDLMTGYYRVYKAYEKVKDYRKAFEFLSLYEGLKDSLKNSENLSAIEKLKSRYELEKKESEISLLTHGHQVATLRRNIFIVALTGLLMIGFLLYNRYRLITQRKLAVRRQQLDYYTQSLIEKSETINRINHELELVKGNSSSEEAQIAKIHKILQSNIVTDEDWENFKKAFEDIYPGFFSRLRFRHPTITVSELRLSALIKLNLSNKEVATMLGISPESVKTSRYRLKKKFGLAENETVETFIKKLESPAGTDAALQRSAAP